MKTKTKLINLLTIRGKKEVGEKILKKSIKELNKNSAKKFNDVFNFALIYSEPIFKLHKIKNSKKKRKKNLKEIPGFIKKKDSRLSLAIKLLIANIKNKNETFYKTFYKEIIQIANQKGSTIQIKNELQKKVLKNKHYFKYYRWS